MAKNSNSFIKKSIIDVWQGPKYVSEDLIEAKNNQLMELYLINTLKIFRYGVADVACFIDNVIWIR